jgi:predicted ribosomally synthesized peptide with nif11-like leader
MISTKTTAMNTDNITAFLAKAQSDEALAVKVATLQAEAAASTAAALVRLSQEAGTPFTAEEFLAAQQVALSDEALEQVAGGAGYRTALFNAAQDRQNTILSAARVVF